MINASGPQGEPVGPFYDFELVARANPQSVQHPCRKSNLAFEVILTIMAYLLTENIIK